MRAHFCSLFPTPLPPTRLDLRLPRRQNFIDNPAGYKGLFRAFPALDHLLVPQKTLFNFEYSQ